MEGVVKHYGKRGMRWGVRTAPKSGGAKSASNPKVEKAKEIGKSLAPAAKTVAKIGVRTALVAGAAAIGIPAVVAAGTVAAMEASAPGFISAGKDAIRLALDEHGLKDMSTLDKVKAEVHVKSYEAEQNIREHANRE